MSIGNEPAYSTTDSHDFKGLTKRELFAAMAMQGLYAGNQFSASEGERAAHWSVEIADALLAQLSKESP